MKTIKLLAILCASAVCGQAYAAQVGDIMLVDGYPTIVIYTDETGEHGLVCSSKAISNLEFESIVKNKIKKEDMGEEEAKEAALTEIGRPLLVYMNRDDKQVRKNTEALSASNSIYGKENAEQILAYCEANDIDMAAYFPEQYWAMQMGDGWFIPGVYELELYTKFLTNGRELGKKGKLVGKAYSEFLIRNSAICGKVVEDYGTSFTLPYKAISSTLINSTWGKDKANKKLIGKVPASAYGGGTLLQLMTMVVNASVRAAHKSEFLSLYLLGGTSFQFKFVTNQVDNDGNVIAVKEF